MSGYDKRTIDVVIKTYKKKDIKNDYREICDKIIQTYERAGIIEDYEVRLINDQCEAKGDELAASVHNYISNPEGEVRIALSKIPRNCMECPLLVVYSEEESYGFGKTKACPFGCNCYEMRYGRPSGCPIAYVKK